MDKATQLLETVSELTKRGKGLLAADESTPTISKRLQELNIESSESTRRTYRNLLFTTPGINQFLNGIILFEETLFQKIDEGTVVPDFLRKHQIMSGIKVDKGLVPLANADGDTITQGLDGLADRLRQYREAGARFAKWREVYRISEHNPTSLGLRANAEVLARYAAICQEQLMVPIVEPEVLMDGDHSMARCSEVSEAVLSSVFEALHAHQVLLEAVVLKPSMVLPGKNSSHKAHPELVASETMKVLSRTVPAAIPSINFLSGGQSAAEATANLQALNAKYPKAPWRLSFSYSRALQAPVMTAWAGKESNRKVAQGIFARRVELNGLACRAEYDSSMETE